MSTPVSHPQGSCRSLSPASYQQPSSLTPSASSNLLDPSRSPLDSLHHHPDSLASSSSSRPTLNRARSASTATSSTGSYATTALSTAPTSPVSMSNRHWRQTPNVPFAVSQRHQRRRVSPNGREEEHTRWLSEDEGLVGVTRPMARRRRRQSSDANGDDVQGDQPDRGGPGPNTTGGLNETRPRKGDGRNLVSTASRQTKSPTPKFPRPRIRRTHSCASPSHPADMPTGTLGDSSVGFEPPSIQHLVPAPTSDARVLGLGLSDLSHPMDLNSRPASFGTTEISTIGTVPDYAAGRGGDGIGGFGMPAAFSIDKDEERGKQRERETSLLGKLRQILDW